VRADLRHEKDAVSPAGEAFPEERFGHPAPILPAVVEKCDPGIHGLLHEPDGGWFVWCITEVMAAAAQG
jgi:hypothetical protein